MVFVLDNYDSFTYNLVQYLGELSQARGKEYQARGKDDQAPGRQFEELVIRRNDELTPADVEALHPDRILISPGPCTPADAGISIALIQHFARLALSGGPRIPILGVCLGHQAIGAAFGGNVVRAPKLMHGKTSEIAHDGRTLFAGIPSTTTCTRYHSLIVSPEGLPDELEVSARTVESDTSGDSGSSTEPGTIMALRHRSLPIEGVQFHPESVLTIHGKQMIANFLKLQ